MSFSEVNLYEPRNMQAALLQKPAPKRFLLDTFFKNQVTFTTDVVDVDVEKTKRCMAGFTAPDNSANIVERSGYYTYSTRPGYIKEMRATRVADLLKRAIGTTIYEQQNLQARAAAILAQDLQQLDERIVRREEQMCSEALYTGKVVIQGPGLNHTVDFGYEAGEHILALTGSSCWNHPDSDPMFDMDDWKIRILRRCGIAPTHAIFGTDVYKAVINNPKVKERLDIRRMELGEITVKQVGNCRYFGTLLPSMLECYAYDEWYVDPVTGQEKPMVPPDTVLLASTEARTAMNYGLIQNLYSLTAATRFPMTWVEPDGRARYVQLESAPLPNIIQADAFLVAHVIS